MKDIAQEVRQQRSAAERRAWVSLARYKFWVFGYWAAAWVKYNALLEPDDREVNPWRGLLKAARDWQNHN